MPGKEFVAAGRKGTAKSIRAFRAAMRSGDCKRAGAFLDMIETGYARRSTVYQLKDQFYAAGCARPWERKR
jgi:hypothetical protein